MGAAAAVVQQTASVGIMYLATMVRGGEWVGGESEVAPGVWVLGVHGVSGTAVWTLLIGGCGSPTQQQGGPAYSAHTCSHTTPSSHVLMSLSLSLPHLPLLLPSPLRRVHWMRGSWPCTPR
jgi:hypothetical protein